MQQKLQLNRNTFTTKSQQISKVFKFSKIATKTINSKCNKNTHIENERVAWE